MIENDSKSIAILLSTYNGSKYLNEQFQTLYNQTYKNLVIYARDDGSSDNTREIIQRWKKKMSIKMVDASNNLGAARSFMELVYHCGNYEYYAFCDQDDLWDADKIEKAIKKIKDYDQPYLYFCNGRYVDENGAVTRDKTTVPTEDLNFWSAIVCGFCPGCSMVWNNELMKIVRRVNYRSLPMHDLLFCLSALAFGNVLYDETVHYSRRMHENNVVGRSGKSKIQLFKQRKKLWLKEGKKNPIGIFLQDIKRNLISENVIIDLEELEDFIQYKVSIKSKIELLINKKYISSNQRATCSFKVRILFNLI
ncbi:glycosyltransferase [Butyrivibrio sp. AE2015]|uniref:glycosyltransferase n=1 Tax=Butyrivibrio sp. AE2015 TaxID=1280663 RepID=UPI0003B6246F|nr:glycosyltransferase [Butyrivibrio sp. AE2015]